MKNHKPLTKPSEPAEPAEPNLRPTSRNSSERNSSEEAEKPEAKPTDWGALAKLSRIRERITDAEAQSHFDAFVDQLGASVAASWSDLVLAHLGEEPAKADDPEPPKANLPKGHSSTPAPTRHERPQSREDWLAMVKRARSGDDFARRSVERLKADDEFNPNMLPGERELARGMLSDRARYYTPGTFKRK